MMNVFVAEGSAGTAVGTITGWNGVGEFIGEGISVNVLATPRVGVEASVEVGEGG
jgi:hypothetical protein